jgi:hypothetical protein
MYSTYTMSKLFQMSFEEDSNLPPPDLLSPDTLRRRRFQQQRSASNVKFENPETSNSKKRVRFRKRAKSMAANTSSDLDQVS